MPNFENVRNVVTREGKCRWREDKCAVRARQVDSKCLGGEC